MKKTENVSLKETIIYVYWKQLHGQDKAVDQRRITCIQNAVII